ncbi:MAG: ABC transporter permease [Muribaculaceae bacterium]|nr:ABC transporter permease [Muribaculaceae bacterium]
MKTDFLKFVRKEFLHILRDKRTLLIVLLQPAVMLLLFGFAISTEVNDVRVVVVAPNLTDGVKDAVNRVAANPNFSFCGYISQNEVDDVLRGGDVAAVVVFAADYDRRMMQTALGEPAATPVQIVVDASNTNIASSASAYLQNIIAGTASAQSMFETHLLYNPQMKSAYNFVPGIMGVIFILVCAMMTSVSIVREKEVGTMEVLLVSPVRPMRIIVAKMIPYFAISCVTLAIILLLSRYVLDVPMSGGVGGIVGLSMLYLALALAFGLLISTFASTQVAAWLVSAVVMLMPMVMLSGMLFPIENLPLVLQGVSCIIPARWYIAAVRKMMIEGLPFSAVLHEFAVLCTMLVALVGLSLKKFNDKLE